MIVDVQGITKYYGFQCVLDDLSLRIDEPKIIALVAPNGTGKTTLLNIICNIEQAESGNIKLLERSNKDVSIFKEVTYLQDRSVLYDELTGADHIEFISSIHKIDSETKQALIKRLKMTSFMDKKVENYSLGMKQKLLFAMAILPNPKILILDEPLNGLDPSSVLLVRKMLKEFHNSGCCIILSSHNLDEIDKITSDIYFLYEGSLLMVEEVVSDRIEYIFVLESMDEVINYVAAEKIDYETFSSKKIAITLTTIELKFFTTFCHEKNIVIHDQAMNKQRTEELYFELYGGDYNDSV